MSLTQEQSDAFSAISYWMVTDDKNLVIDGPAGAGKGYLLQYLDTNEAICKMNELYNLVTSNQLPPIVFTATTNEAVTSLGIHGAQTIYRYTGIRPSFNKLVAHKIINKTVQIVIVDEASFIDKEAFELIQQQLPNAKFIWVMDQYQLPPVGSSIPHIATLDCPWVNLTQVNRSKGAIQKLVTDLRNNVATKASTHLPSYHNNNDIIVCDSVDEFNRMMKVDFQNNSNVCVLGYHNELCNSYNKAVHSKVMLQPDFPNVDALPITTRYATSIPVGSTVYIHKIFEEDSTFKGKDAEYTFNTKIINTSKGIFYDADLSDLSARDKKALLMHNPMLNNLSLGYAMTTHKSQGKTIETVYVHAQDIKSSWDNELVRRLLYVAISRAAKKVVIYG